MYRTEALYETLKGFPLEYPICVPSYGRPDNAFIRWVQQPGFDIPKERLFMFIRNTPEQKRIYKPLSKWVNLVLIPESTKDLGDTRMHIVNWGIKHKHELLFMLDDRVNGIWWLNTVVRNGVTYLDTDKRSTPSQAFKIWAFQHLDSGVFLTGIGNKGFHWMTGFINDPIKPLNRGFPSVAVAISPTKFAEHSVNYAAIEKVGIEDSYILYQLLIRKLPFCMLQDVCYNQVKPSQTGGNSAIQPGMTRDERLTIVKRIFWERTLKLPWGTPHPGFRVVNRKNESNVILINYPYWRNYYANSE